MSEFRFGHPDQYEVGSIFDSRKALSDSGIHGPRKEYVANKTVKEVFDEEWISQVLGDKAPCSPIGWRGFMLGNGLIWYNKADDGWTIFP